MFLQKTQRNLCISFDDEALQETEAAVVSFLSSCNYKTPPAPWATYCSSSSTSLWPTSDVSADMFTVRAVIHSTLCCSCQFDRVVLRFHVRAHWRGDCNYPDWVFGRVRRSDVSLHKHGGCKRAGVEMQTLT